MKLASLADIEQGAAAFLKSPRREGLTAVENAAYNEFMDFADLARDCEWDMEMFAFLLTRDARKAMDKTLERIEESQPELDEFGNAADRGYDRLKENGEA
jgi:hypothetical protein